MENEKENNGTINGVPARLVTVCKVNDGEGGFIFCKSADIGNAYYAMLGDNPNDDWHSETKLPFVEKKWHLISADFWEEIEKGLQEYSG